MGCFISSENLSKRSKKKITHDTNPNQQADQQEPTSGSTPNQQEQLPSPTSEEPKEVSHKDESEEKSKDVILSLAKLSLPKDVGVNRLEEATEEKGKISALQYTFDQMVNATENFQRANFLGGGGFGKVYKGKMQDQMVAIKKLDHGGLQGVKEFVVEVMTLSLVDHPNLVKLHGYCVDGAERMLVYEYMPLGSLEDHLHGRTNQVLDWNARMKIAAGATRGLEYLHDKLQPPIIYRDLKSSNILLGEDYHPKLSDFGLARPGPTGGDTHVSTRVMGTYGYCAPEYAMTGQLTFKSDIFSFGVLLLEILTGRKAIDETRPARERNLVAWARPLFANRRNFHRMVDPKLQAEFPARGFYRALSIAAMCVHEEPSSRPLVADLVTALAYLADQPYSPRVRLVNSSLQFRASGRP